MREPHDPSDSTPSFGPLLSSPVAATVASLGDLVRGLVIAAIALVAVIIALRIGVGFYVTSQVSQSLGESARIAGLDAAVTHWLETVAGLGLGLAITGLVIQAALSFLHPFRPALHCWKPILALLAISGTGAALPGAIRGIRDLDPSGLPAHMIEQDPASAIWFTPDGNPVLFYADHLDGHRRFWNRPGHTPRDGALAVPVTSAIRTDWWRKAGASARPALPAAPSFRSTASPLRPSASGKPSIPPAASAAPVGTNPGANPAQSFPLLPGKEFRLGVRGDRVEIWSDGLVAAAADGGAFETISQPGRRLRFTRGAQNVLVRPLSASATRVYVRKMQD